MSKTVSVKVTPAVKEAAWKNFTKKTSSKNELKKVFLGENPTTAYGKVSKSLQLELKKESAKSAKKSSTSKKTSSSSMGKSKIPSLKPKKPKSKSKSKSKTK
jgi:hypothetical protein